MYSEALAVLGAALLVFWAAANYWFYRSVRVARREKVARLVRRNPRPVTVVIAARNEEKRLTRLLGGLTRVGYPLVEIIIVDDESNDSTPRVVENFSLIDRRIRLVRVESRPEGWAPKPYALSLGARSSSRGEVYLFMDADVVVENIEAFQALAGLAPHSSEIIAFIPRFYCRGFYCKAVQAFMTGTVHAFYGFHRVTGEEDFAWMYGCCWMIRRDYYYRLGGHGLVKDSVVEDRDFADRAKKLGARIVAIEATDTISVETYEDLRGYRGLITRLSIDRARRRGRLALLVEAAAIGFIHLAPCTWPLVLVYSLEAGLVFTAAWLLQKILYARGSKYNGYSVFYALPATIAGLAPVLLGLVDAARGKPVLWKGRSYA